MAPRRARTHTRADLRTRLDRSAGDAIAGLVRRHHARRLARLGLKILDAQPGGWADDAPTPATGNDVEVLIDGATAFQRIVVDIRAARSHVHLTGWFLSPELVLEDGDMPVIVRDLLAEAARRIDVRVLLWAGAPLPVFTPARRLVRAVRSELSSAGPIHCALDACERPLHCHHEKSIVIDGEIAFVGGIDLTSLAGDRRDSQRHPARAALGWHDVTTRTRGPLAADVADHFNLRWHAVTGQRLPDSPPPAPAGDVTAQLTRTLPERIYAGVSARSFGILESYVRALRSAERLIYLETQYLWSPEIVDVLADKLRRPPDDRFRLVVLLPARPKGGADDTRGALGELIEADAGAKRVLACCLYARSGSVSDAIYVHAKVGIVDDRWLTVGSANLNDHSLFNDTELNVVTHHAGLARATRLSLWAEHLESTPSDVDGDPTDVIDQKWRAIAEEQLDRRRRGLPLTHRLVRLDHVSRRSARVLGPLQGLLVDG
jgi:phosphatidylserine/phosphatidylglycerophosphate/cardiolipin synthase-like enzyme